MKCPKILFVGVYEKCGYCEYCEFCEYFEQCEYCGQYEKSRYCGYCEYCEYCKQCEYCPSVNNVDIVNTDMIFVKKITQPQFWKQEFYAKNA